MADDEFVRAESAMADSFMKAAPPIDLGSTYDGPPPPAFDASSYAGSKTGDCDSSCTPTAKAAELVCLLREDSRMAVVDAKHSPCASSALARCSSMQRDALAASARLLKLCHEDPESGPRRHLVAVANAFLAHRIAIDQLLCLLVCCPYVGPNESAAASWWVEHDGEIDGGDDYFDGAADSRASAERCVIAPAQATGDFYLAMARGPVGLIHELLSHAPHPVLAAFATSPWFPKACAVLVRFLRDAAAPNRLAALLAALASSALSKAVVFEFAAATPVATALAEDAAAVAAVEAAAATQTAEGTRDAAANSAAALEALAASCAALLASTRALSAPLDPADGSPRSAPKASPELDRRCLACGRPTTTRCSRCRLVFFCNNGKKCLAAVWKEHKQTCTPASARRVY